MPEITKLQRWLDLIAYLVGRKLPVPVEDLMRDIPAYAAKAGDPTSEATARRTFERDKDELRRAGIPIRTVRYSINFGLEQVDGYRVDGRDFYLPYLRLLGQEGRAPQGAVELGQQEAKLAVEALRRVSEVPAFPLEGEARSALRKLTFDLAHVPEAGAEPPFIRAEPESVELRARLRQLSNAVVSRKRVTFTYHGIHRGEETERDVAPYGLLYQKGHWYLIGHDRLRDDVRVFRVARMDNVVMNGARMSEPDYEPPEDFSLDRYVGREAWELGDDPPVRAEALFRFPRSVWAERNGYGVMVREEEGGAVVRAFDVQQVGPFLRWLLGFAGDVELLTPESMKDELRRLATEVARRHGGPHAG